jgi:serine/threonine-protein kinase
MLGRLLDGRYRIEDRIARGGMATVYAATDTRLDRVVALKIMHMGLACDEDLADRFVHEARSAARLNHPQVVAVFDQGEDDGTVYLAMEYVPGRTLREVIQADSPMPARRALALLEQILTALAAAHRAGLVHRDVKPENVLITPSGQVKVADFGLARAVSSTSSATAAVDVLVGTVSYVAPELVLHESTDARVDVYASGVLLYEMLTGRKPHEADTPIQVAYKHVHEDVPAPSVRCPGLPAYVDALVARSTARDRDRRPPDAQVLLRHVRRVLAALDEALPNDEQLTEDLALRHQPAASAADDWNAFLFDSAATDVEPTAVTVVAPPQDQVADAHASPAPADELPRPGRQPSGSRPGPTLVRRRRGRILLLLVLLLAVAAGLTGWQLAAGRYAQTPPLTGLPLDQADVRAAQAGLAVRVASGSYSETVQRGEVISTSPGSGDRIDEHGTIEVVLSMGKERYPVPAVEGMTLEAARRALADAHLDVRTQHRHSAHVDEGLVLAVSPSEDRRLRPDSLVRLTLSRGPAQSQVTGARSAGPAYY